MSNELNVQYQAHTVFSTLIVAAKGGPGGQVLPDRRRGRVLGRVRRAGVEEAPARKGAG